MEHFTERFWFVVDPHFHNKILFSDEAYFGLGGRLIQNIRLFSELTSYYLTNKLLLYFIEKYILYLTTWQVYICLN